MKNQAVARPSVSLRLQANLAQMLTAELKQGAAALQRPRSIGFSPPEEMLRHQPSWPTIDMLYFYTQRAVAASQRFQAQFQRFFAANGSRQRYRRRGQRIAHQIIGTQAEELLIFFELEHFQKLLCYLGLARLRGNNGLLEANSNLSQQRLQRDRWGQDEGETVIFSRLR